MEAEDLAELRVVDEARHCGIDRTVALQTNELRSNAYHAPPVEKRHMGELGVAFLENLLGVFEKTRVTRDVAGALGGNLAIGGIEIVAVVEAVSVFVI